MRVAEGFRALGIIRVQPWRQREMGVWGGGAGAGRAVRSQCAYIVNRQMQSFCEGVGEAEEGIGSSRAGCRPEMAGGEGRAALAVKGVSVISSAPC